MVEQYWKEKEVCCGVEWMKAPRINGESDSREAEEINWLYWALSGVARIRSSDSVEGLRWQKLARRSLISNRCGVSLSDLLDNLSKLLAVGSNCKTHNQCRMSIPGIS